MYTSPAQIDGAYSDLEHKKFERDFGISLAFVPSTGRAVQVLHLVPLTPANSGQVLHLVPPKPAHSGQVIPLVPLTPAHSGQVLHLVPLTPADFG